MLMMVIYKKKLAIIKKLNRNSHKSKYGKQLHKFLLDCIFFIKKVFYIGILKVLMYLLPMICIN